MLRSLRALLVAVALVLGLAAPVHAMDAEKRKKPSRPEVYKVRPNVGDVDGGTVVILRGKFFSKTTRVFMHKTPVTDFEVLSDKQLRVVTPPHPEGLYRIWVTTKVGRAKPGAFDGFRYIDNTVPPPPPPLAPAISAISPNRGSIAGGTTVTITGVNFVAGSQVFFGERAATSVTVNSGTSITATTPSFPGLLGGNVSVRVTTPIGTSPDTSADDFRYQGLLG